MPQWRNWSGRLSAQPKTLAFLRSEEDARALVMDAAKQGRTIRCAGAGHSHSSLVPNDDIIADVSGLSGVLEVDQQTQRAWIWGGSRIYTLGRQLHDAGLGLANQGDIDQQSIAGAVATGTHGTGEQLRNLSAAVTGLRLVTASGELLQCTAEENASIWQAARLHLGGFGIVTAVQMQLVPAYRLVELGKPMIWADLEDQVETEIQSHRHFEFFWSPTDDVATTKRIDVTDKPAEYPLAEEGSRCAWSYEVLPNHRPHQHTEMEYSVPRANGLDCFNAIRELIQTHHSDVRWPVEYRTLAADDVWLSTAFERDTVTISVHQDVRIDESAYYRDCETIFRRFGGRPHWGKVHYLDAEDLASIHPQWQAWQQARAAVDPNGMFDPFANLS